MSTRLAQRPARGATPVGPLHSLVHRPVLPRPAIGPGGHAPDAITEFLASLMRKHESAAVIIPASR